MAETQEERVLVRRDGVATRITLNRPRALNALDTGMAETVFGGVARAVGDGAAVIWIDGAGDRGFCGGGDIKLMASGVEAGLGFLWTEYRNVARIATSPIPVIAVMDGITMGGGIGLAGHAAIRIVTDTSRLAMPEVRIGFAPDVAGHLLFAHAPGRLGELLAATAGDMTAGDAIALGLADWFVPRERLVELRAAVFAGEDPEEAVRRFAEPAPESELVRARTWFDPIADEALGEPGAVVADPLASARRLISGLERSSDEAAVSAARTVRRMCPMSVVVALAQIDRVRSAGLGLTDMLVDDYRISGRLLARRDFTEGVRAQIIDRDGRPAWSPNRIEELHPAEVTRMLAPHRPDERPLEIPRPLATMRG